MGLIIGHKGLTSVYGLNRGRVLTVGIRALGIGSVDFRSSVIIDF